MLSRRTGSIHDERLPSRASLYAVLGCFFALLRGCEQSLVSTTKACLQVNPDAVNASSGRSTNVLRISRNERKLRLEFLGITRKNGPISGLAMALDTSIGANEQSDQIRWLTDEQFASGYEGTEHPL